MSVNIDDALIVAKLAATEVGSWLLTYYGNVTFKIKNSEAVPAAAIVSDIDATAELKIKKILENFDPNIGFVGEETATVSEDQTYWLVDPIDGTSHFIRGLPFCTVMISLIVDNQIELSVIYNIATQELYHAVKGRGSFKNDRPIHVSNRPLSSAMISFDIQIGTPKNDALHLKLQKATGGLFASINSGYEFAMVASGKLDGRICFEPYGKDWDYAPGALLVQEAGGYVANLGSDHYSYKNHDFIASNPIIAGDLAELLADV